MNAARACNPAKTCAPVYQAALLSQMLPAVETVVLPEAIPRNRGNNTRKRTALEKGIVLVPKTGIGYFGAFTE